MNTAPPVKITSHWRIYGTLPNADQRYPHWGKNFHLGVQADTMEEAIAAAREFYPEGKFVSCNHSGEIHLIAKTP